MFAGLNLSYHSDDMSNTCCWFVFPFSGEKDSPAAQARHYKTLQEMYKKPKPNQDAVCQILDLEFQSRRAFIDSGILKEEDRPAKIFEAYPCFKELHHVRYALVVFGFSTKLALLQFLTLICIAGDGWAAADSG